MGAIARWYRTGVAQPILEPQWSGTSPLVIGLRSGHPTDLPLNCTTLTIPVKGFNPSFYSTDADVKTFMGAHVFLGMSFLELLMLKSTLRLTSIPRILLR